MIGVEFFKLQMSLLCIQYLSGDAPLRSRVLEGVRKTLLWFQDANGLPSGPNEWADLVPALVIARILTGEATPVEIEAFREPLDEEFRALVAS